MDSPSYMPFSKPQLSAREILDWFWVDRPTVKEFPHTWAVPSSFTLKALSSAALART